MSVLDITEQTFLAAVIEVNNSPITIRAALGYSTNNIVLTGIHNPRHSLVEVRNHSGMYSMLITDSAGNFLFNGGVSMELPSDMAAKILYWNFKQVIHFINT